MQQSEDTTFVSVDARESSGSARSRLPYGESLSRKRIERMVKQWHPEREKQGKNDLDVREREDALYTLVNICTTMMRDKRGVVGDVARANSKVSGCTTDRPNSHTAIRRRLERARGRGRARHDSRRRGTGERRSHGCRSRARSTAISAVPPSICQQSGRKAGRT